MFTFRYKLKLAPPRPLNIPLTVSIPKKQSVSEHIQQFGKLHFIRHEKVFPSFQFLWPQTAKEYFARRLSRLKLVPSSEANANEMWSVNQFQD